MTPYFSLPGIRSLAYIPASSLSKQMLLKAIAGIPITIYASPTPIPFTGECTCEVEQTNDNKGVAEVATLTFHTVEQLPTTYALAFLLTDAMGLSYVIGAKEEPFPLITSTKGFGLPAGDASTRTYEVVHKATKALVECWIPAH